MPYLIEKEKTPEAFLFSPRDTVALANVEKRRRRKTKVQPLQRDHKKANPKRKPSEQYSDNAYNHAITRACKKAGVRSSEMDGKSVTAFGGNRSPQEVQH